jgi:hypothetical protein
MQFLVLHRLDQERRFGYQFASIKQQHFAELSAAKNSQFKVRRKIIV